MGLSNEFWDWLAKGALVISAMLLGCMKKTPLHVRVSVTCKASKHGALC